MSRRAAPKANPAARSTQGTAVGADRIPPSAAGQPKNQAWNTAKTIAWSFFGVRRSQDHQDAGGRISPIHVLVAGFVGVFVLVGGLIVLVNWVAA
jgi:Protein of unknown function (DUF2970)